MMDAATIYFRYEVAWVVLIFTMWMFVVLKVVLINDY